MSDLESLSDDDLGEKIRSAGSRLAEANRQRQAILDEQSELQSEFARRKALRQWALYENERRTAVQRGREPPPPPKSAAVLTSAPKSASQTRLASLGGLATALSKPAVPAPSQAPGDRIKIGELITKVSDHATIRYMERAMGFDFEPIRQRIMTPVVEAALRSGLDRIRTAEGVVVASNGVVVSFLPSHSGVTGRKPGRHLKMRERPTDHVDLGEWEDDLRDLD